MAIQNNLKRIVNQKVWELSTINPYGSMGAGALVTGDAVPQYFPDGDNQFVVLSSTSVQRFNPAENAFVAITSPGLGGTFGAGTCAETMVYGAPNGLLVQTATAGTTTTITTSLTLSANLAGKKIKIAAGPNAGTEHTIAYNTQGSNAVITLTAAAGTAFSASTQFYLMTGSLWVFNAGTLSATSFRVFDYATNTWTSRSITGLPATWGTEGQLVRQHSVMDSFASGSVLSSTSTSVTVAALSGTGYNYANYEIEITGGTGVGQVRTITVGTTTTLTIGTAWTTNPDATSTFVIKGDRDVMYLLGNGAVTLYKFIISTNTWQTITPSVARASALASGGTADIVKENPDWTTPIVLTNKVGGQNGRFIYSFRGNGSTGYDLYDIAANSWSVPTYGNQGGETISSVSCSIVDSRNVYIQNGSTGRFLKLNTTTNTLDPWSYNIYPQGTATNGDKMTVVKFQSGSDQLTWIYLFGHTLNTVHRVLVI